MLESVKKLFNKLGFKHRHYEPPAKPRWTVEQLGGGYLYYQHKSVNCPNVEYYKYTRNSLNNGKFLEIEAVTIKGIPLFKGYLATTRPTHLPQAITGIKHWLHKD